MSAERKVRGIFSLGRDESLSEAEVQLGTPDAMEAISLDHHVSRCAMRYRMFTKRLDVQGDDINLIKNILYAMFGFLVITNKEFQDMVATLAAHFKALF